jgi:hypothetical protein
VHIVNLWSRDTIEEYVLELLDKKVHMFELVVGELDMILGNVDAEKTFEDLLIEIWAIEDAAERRAEVERLGERLVEARGAYEDAKTYDDRLFGSDLEVGVGVAR